MCNWIHERIWLYIINKLFIADNCPYTYRVFSPIRERADNLALMTKHCFFTVFMKLQNNDIITFLKILQDYMEHLLIYLFTKIINKISIFITFSAVLIGNYIFFLNWQRQWWINAISQSQVAPHNLTPECPSIEILIKKHFLWLICNNIHLKWKKKEFFFV